MKDTAHIVNTSRGPIIDQDALVAALREGQIGGAGLDVLQAEPIDPDSPLLQMDNVLITPHVAYYSDAAVKALASRCGEEVARVLTGRRPINLVNPEVLEKLPLRPD